MNTLTIADPPQYPHITPIENDAYHTGPGISKTGLWMIWSRSPAHYQFGVREEKPHFTLGSAAHTAILEPDKLEFRYQKGPADRRGNKWADAVEYGNTLGLETLTAGDYDIALRMRDSAGQNAICRALMKGAVFEQAAYWRDEETGVLCRCKPDVYNPGMNVIADIKTTTNGAPDAFSKDVGNFGYHMQDAMYSEGWGIANRREVDGFVFVCVEKAEPFLVTAYEIDAPGKREGHAIYRAALTKYAECLAANHWPGYCDAVQTVGLRRWDYRLTTADPAAEI